MQENDDNNMFDSIAAVHRYSLEFYAG